MSEWKNEAIGKLAITYAGGTPNRAREDYFKGEIPWISSGEVNLPYIDNTKEKITQQALENSSAKWIPKNSVLIAMYGATAGVVSKLLINATSNQAVLALIPNSELVDIDFLYYQVKANKQAILYLAQGSGQPNLSKNLIDEFYINLPVFVKEQRKIAKILSSADSVIAKTQVAIAKYKAIKQGMLNDLFTRGIDIKTGKLRPSYADAPELYKESALGWIPLEWEVKQMEDVISEAVLGIPIRGTSNGFNIPLLKMGNLFWGELILKQVEQVRFTAIENENFLLKYRDLLFNTRNTPELVGKTAIWRNEFPIATFDNNLLRIRFKKGFCSPFVCLFMSFGAGKSNIKSLVDGTTSVAAVYWKNFKKFKIPFPCETEQESIIKRIETIDKNIQTEQQYLHKLQQLKTGLMADLLSGKKKVEEE